MALLGMEPAENRRNLKLQDYETVIQPTPNGT